MNTLEFRVLTQEETDLLERTAHNPPIYTDAFTSDDFSREYWSVCDGLKARLEIFGEEWSLSTGKGDFMMPESRGDSRWVYVNFVSTRLWRPEFVFAVADFLSSLKEDYRVGCLTELNDEEFLNHPLIYLVVSSTVVYGSAEQGIRDAGSVTWSNCNAYLQRFGFPPGRDGGIKRFPQ
jgi:hypothetical protein